MNRFSNMVDDIVIVAKQVKRGADSEAGYNRVNRGGQIRVLALGTMLSCSSV